MLHTFHGVDVSTHPTTISPQLQTVLLKSDHSTISIQLLHPALSSSRPSTTRPQHHSSRHETKYIPKGHIPKSPIMAPQIPTEADFAHLAPGLSLAFHFPSPPESTTTFLVLFHGLGDHETPFAGFAQSLALPGVLGISVRGTAALPPELLPFEVPEPKHFHYGDDLTLDTSTGEIDEDPGFKIAEKKVLDGLIRETLVEKLGWELSDVMFFGFGQGGSLALGLASRLQAEGAVVDVTDKSKETETSDKKKAFKGVVSIGGPLPLSMVSTASARDKSATKVLVCQLKDEQVDLVKKDFIEVEALKWGRGDVRMPRDQDEVLPIMKFFADRLNNGF